jgi:hypothetical protein
MRKLLIFAALLGATALLVPGLAQAQAPERQALPGGVTPRPIPLPNDCPAPIHLTLTAANPPNIFAGDFPNSLPTHGPLNSPAINSSYFYTFQWPKPEHRCCQITSAVLTVHMKANQRGQSANSGDACNDDITVWNNRAAVAPYNQRIYTCPFPVGQLATTTWNLTGMALANINANNRLSFGVEDDTSVTSATLQLTGCCLTN